MDNISAVNSSYGFSSRGSSNSYSVRSSEFGGLTSRPHIKKMGGEQGYHQASGLIPKTGDMEKALAYLQSVEDGGSKVASNPYAAKPVNGVGNFEAMGEAWKGFSVQANNGTGELSPVIAGRADEIVGLDLSA